VTIWDIIPIAFIVFVWGVWYVGHRRGELRQRRIITGPRYKRRR
jgi:hypothetical protein